MVTPLPGGVGISGLRVYDQEAADGLCGGTPHMHLVCSEAYVVLGGRGSVQTLTTSGYADTPLRPGDVVRFTPGTIHRLVNGGGLRLVVLMQNSGLPEAGDAVFTFPAAVLADPDAYRAAASLTGDHAAAALRRLDLALKGFLTLRDEGQLREFHVAAHRLKRELLDEWEARWRAGALAAAEETGRQLDRLKAGDLSHLDHGAVVRLERPEEPLFGMCGLLQPYTVPAHPHPSPPKESFR
ncbi:MULTISPECIES: cupin domain-containing protein [unclassified Streptomyces]|uniref:cupin domain-containing protein n=1 Tax=unclassified Streptomyces TaxID=2593676 RepID=UPI0006F7399E|nr:MULTISPECIES: cupin domain-containing protein [unclassified Streptomyces]KQX49940.1 cupin [Streptomyces sp. Root1304]KRA80017.1 cupin [Streptomyces sp. Root66D1]